MEYRSDDFLRQAGQLIFFGFDGYELNDHARRAIRKYHLGNVILFTRNYRDPAQFYSLIQSLQQEAMEVNGVPLLIAIDQEGGSVVRIIRDATWFPGPMATRVAGNPDLARQLGQGVGAEMAAFGLNLNLAPVMNLASNPDSPHAGARCWGATPEAGGAWAMAYIEGIQESVYATAKHFPSIGNSKVDLHLSLGQNNHSREHIESFEMGSVRNAIKAGVSVVMTSHEMYPAIDDGPSTLSSKIVTGYLKEKYGFNGAVISDCMEMKALAQRVPTPEACVKAVQAGVDMLLICHTEQTQIASVRALAQAVETGRLSRTRFDQACERIRGMKKALRFPDRCPDPETDSVFVDNRKLVQNVCEAAITEQGNRDVFTCGSDERFLLLAPPPAALTMVDEQIGAAHLALAVREAFPSARCVEYPLPLTQESLKQLQKEMDSEEYSKILIGTYNAHGDVGQLDLLTAAYESGKPVGAIALRTPYDARWFERADASLLTYEYTPPMVSAVIRRMRGQIHCSGKLPDDVLSVLKGETI